MKLFKPIKEGFALRLSILFFLTIPSIGLVDYYTGPFISFSLIYILPVSALAWLNSRPSTVLASIITALTWVIVDFKSSRFPFSILSYTWNFSSRIIVLMIIATLISALRRALLHAHHLSRRDSLTNALNYRGFIELAEREIYRSTRSNEAMTIIYLDVDDFKAINDALGHKVGDGLLVSIVDVMHRTTRKSDLVARLGGDEFVILLPDTGQEAARSTVTKIRKSLLDLKAGPNWPITFSMGVLTYVEMPKSLDAMVGMADQLMYTIKVKSKNGIAYSMYPDRL